MSEAAAQVVVYRARNLVNGHSYIGYTARGLPARERQHRAAARQNRGHHFHAAIRKYGQENFVFEVVMDFQADEELARIFEQEAIKSWKPEYNLSYGGEGGTMRPETRAKLSAAQRGRLSPFKGVPRSEAVKAKISAANKGQRSHNKGKIASAETRRKMRDIRAGISLDMTENRTAALAISIRKAQKANERKTTCLTDGLSFSSAKSAGEYYSVSGKLIRQSIARGHLVRGLRFTYEVPA